MSKQEKEKTMKNELESKFYKEYGENCELYAIQLNGFSHKVFYKEHGEKRIDDYTNYMSEFECKQSTRARELFKNVPHHNYQGQPVEYVYIEPALW